MKHIQTAATGMAALVAATMITATPTAIAHATLPKREYRTSITPTAKITECIANADGHAGRLVARVTDPDNIGFHVALYQGGVKQAEWDGIGGGQYGGESVSESTSCKVVITPNKAKQVPVIPDFTWNQMVEQDKALTEWANSPETQKELAAIDARERAATSKPTAKSTTKSTAKATAKSTTKSTAKSTAKASVSAAPSVPVSSVSASAIPSASVTPSVSSSVTASPSVAASPSRSSNGVDVADAPAVTSPVRSASNGVNGWLVAAGVVVIVAAAGAGVWWRRIVKKTR